jgi:hypothetical protein
VSEKRLKHLIFWNGGSTFVGTYAAKKSYHYGETSTNKKKFNLDFDGKLHKQNKCLPI